MIEVIIMNDGRKELKTMRLMRPNWISEVYIHIFHPGPTHKICKEQQTEVSRLNTVMQHLLDDHKIHSNQLKNTQS